MQWNWEKEIKPEATTDDTIALVNQTIFDYSKSPFVKKLTERISAASDKFPGDKTHNFLRTLFDYCCNRITYERDPEGWERVWTPELTNNVRRGDCKKFTVLIGAVLTCKGIPGYARVVSYDGETREHIYAIALWPRYVVLDPVNDKKYNQEIEHKASWTYTFDGKLHREMKLSQMGSDGRNKMDFRNMLSGVGNTAARIDDDLAVISGMGCPTPMNEIYRLAGVDDMGDNEYSQYLGRKSKDEKKKKKEERKEKRKNILNVAAKAGFAPMRGAFLLLLEMGQFLEKSPLKIHLASKMAQTWLQNRSGVIDMWSKFGGNPDALRKAIIHGSGQQISGMGAIAPTLAAAAAAITMAAPVIIAAKKLMVDTGVIKEGSKEDENSETAIDDAEDEYSADGKPPITLTPMVVKYTEAVVNNKDTAASSNGGQGNLLKDSSTLSFTLKLFILALVGLSAAGITPLIPALAIASAGALTKLVQTKFQHSWIS